jgi:ATP-dependent Zn protease
MTQPTVLLVVLLEQRWKIQKIKLVAYHEVGHAIVGSVLENHDEVEK